MQAARRQRTGESVSPRVGSFGLQQRTAATVPVLIPPGEGGTAEIELRGQWPRSEEQQEQQEQPDNGGTRASPPPRGRREDVAQPGAGGPCSPFALAVSEVRRHWRFHPSRILLA